jgi:hypothetical protein
MPSRSEFPVAPHPDYAFEEYHQGIRGLVHIARVGQIDGRGHSGLVEVGCVGRDSARAWVRLPEGTVPNCIACIGAGRP